MNESTCVAAVATYMVQVKVQIGQWVLACLQQRTGTTLPHTLSKQG
jgi:hypothetical protein